MLVVDQNATVALGAASYGYVLGGGRVVDSGPELLDKPELVERYFGVRGVVRGQASAELIEVLRQVLR